MKPYTVYLDMDGVLCDFVSHAFEAHGQIASEPYPEGEYDIAKVFGLSEDEFWEPINKSTDFWETIPKTAEFHEIVAVAKNAFGDRVRIATSPSRSPQSYSGKKRWIDTRMRGTIAHVSEAKHELAKPGRVLIDDSDEQCRLWRENGGIAILWPQPWNSNHFVDDKIGWLKFELHFFGLGVDVYQ